MEKRHNYVRKTAELATQFYINPATNVAGLILAGSADFKTELSQSDMFDPRLQAKILNVVDVSYGGENGFNQPIEPVIRYTFQCEVYTREADINRYSLKNNSTGEIVIKHLNKEQESNVNNFRDSNGSAELEVQDKISFLERFANEYRKFGCSLEFVTNKSQEGSQFCRGFGGIGGILRYQLDMRTLDGEVYDDSE
ncbi:Peptide chain release factor eRF1/aRF [Parasponia andersonii]|uniref:Peptide chain release factor eRF1/aRF n=1 Tax=Parasponia andersonii TaxID=3476 RepID=A0A2P5AD90_PARAD|nr:Peptide chain release factor eRF1/aRF [Parasponia andersonii]